MERSVFNMKLAVAFLLVLGCFGLVFAARVPLNVVYYPNPRPDPLTDCCIQGIPVCARLSQELSIQDLGCEITCRSLDHPGSLGCDYSGDVPACECYNDDQQAVALRNSSP